MIWAIVVFDIDGVVRDVGGSYRRAIADTVEYFTNQGFRPSSVEIDRLKSEGIWNNDWDTSQELIYRYFEAQGRSRSSQSLDYQELVNFFQSRYRGEEITPYEWTGYIHDEPLLTTPDYFQSLTTEGIGWGFFSGAMRAEAYYVLQGKLGLSSPILVAMEDGPSKPDPQGLFQVVNELDQRHQTDGIPVIYVGDTVADLYTVTEAKVKKSSRQWIGIGVLPPHVQTDPLRCENYRKILQQAGAKRVFSNLTDLTPSLIRELILDS